MSRKKSLGLLAALAALTFTAESASLPSPRLPSSRGAGTKKYTRKRLKKSKVRAANKRARLARKMNRVRA